MRMVRSELASDAARSALSVAVLQASTTDAKITRAISTSSSTNPPDGEEESERIAPHHLVERGEAGDVGDLPGEPVDLDREAAEIVVGDLVGDEPDHEPVGGDLAERREGEDELARVLRFLRVELDPLEADVGR